MEEHSGFITNTSCAIEQNYYSLQFLQSTKHKKAITPIRISHILTHQFLKREALMDKILKGFT